MSAEIFVDVAGRPLTSWAELVLVGLSHREAGVTVREQLAIPAGGLTRILTDLRRDGVLSGVVVLSTCNRLEIYASSPDAGAAETLLRSWFTLRCPESAAHLFARRGAEAVGHLFRVASGLDSIVVGETQILGQVKSFYDEAKQAGHTDKILNKLFQAAAGAGKKVRSRTGIAQGISSCGGAAVAMAQKVLPGVESLRILLIGAGKMAEAAAKHMLERSGATLTIANRNVENAQALAAQYGAKAITLEDGMASIASYDVLIASTACPHYIVTRERLAGLAAARGGRPLVVIDLGVPRNVDPATAELPGVHLRNIDDLEAVIADTLVRRRGEIQAAEAISSELAGEFCAALAKEPAPLARTVSA